MLKGVLKEKGCLGRRRDEGGFAPQISSTRQAIEMLVLSIEKAGYKPGEEIALAIDSAASELYKDGVYRIEGNAWNSEEMVAFYESLINDYPIVSIEDGFGERLGRVKLFTSRCAKKIQIVADDIFVTNPRILMEGIREAVANCVLIKLNQIGTVTETFTTIEIAKRAGYTCVISHRSGETEILLLPTSRSR